MATTNQGVSINNLSDAIDVYRATAAEMFVEAQNELDRPPAPQVGENAEDVRKKSQGKLGAAFSQLSNAETILSAQIGREGYAEVVTLMTATATAAGPICVKLKELADTVASPSPPTTFLTGTALQERLQMIEALTEAVQALAQLSPASVWEKGSMSGGATGVQREIPPSAIDFENDAVHTTRTDPIPKAFIATAAEAGAAGNNIQVTIARRTDTTVDVTVTETDRYEGVTLATLTAQLGTTGSSGTKPGLLCVKANPAGAPDPPGGVARVGGTATSPTWRIAGGGATTAVTLEPRRTTPATLFAPADFTVAISNVQPAATGATFTLTVTWTRTVSDVAVAGIMAMLSPLGYVVTFTAPEGGAKLPRPGTVKLTGGNEAAVATSAAASVLANE